MNRVLVFIFTLQAASLLGLPTRSKEYENFDQQCFDDAFPNLPTFKKSSSLNMRIVHRRDWSGTTGEDHFILSDTVHTLNENEKLALVYEYKSLSGFPDFNPRNLTLFYDGSSVFAGIGRVHEQDSSFTSPNKQWKWFCSNATLTEKQRTGSLSFNSKMMVFSIGGWQAFGSGADKLELSIL